MEIKNLLIKIKQLTNASHAQALTEYIMVTAVIGLAMAGIIALMKWPIANYLKKILETIAAAR